MKKMVVILFAIFAILFTPVWASQSTTNSGWSGYGNSAPSSQQQSQILQNVSQSLRNSKTGIEQFLKSFKWLIAIMVFGVIAYSGISTYVRERKEMEQQGIYRASASTGTDIMVKVAMNMLITTVVMYVMIGVFTVTFANYNGGQTPVTFQTAWDALVVDFWRNVFP